jgi:hypothetical protein
MVTAVIAVIAKLVGVLVAPGLHGVVGQPVIETFDTASAALAYLLAALLVALVCASTFELARVRRIGGTARGTVIGITGLVVALASPAVVTRLHTVASLALAVTTSASVLVAGIVAVRGSHTRAIGALLSMLAFCALVRVVGWELAAIGAERPNPTLFSVGRVLATLAVVIHGVSVLLAAAWLGTRTPTLKSRILANAAVVCGFAVTWFAFRTGPGMPSSAELVLRTSLTEATGMPMPYAIGSVGAFLVPSSIFLAIVALFQRRESPAIIAAVALALLSHGAFDIPMHALLATAAAQWGMLAMVERS